MSENALQFRGQPNGFLCLPSEVREKVYFHIFLRGAVLVQYLHFEVDPWIKSMWESLEQSPFSPEMEDIVPRRKTGILSVSRQISEEVLNILYVRNLFVVHVHGGAHDKLLKLRPLTYDAFTT